VTLCRFTMRQDGKWVCCYCLRPSILATDSPPRRACTFAVVPQPTCPAHEIASRLTPTGIDRLQRCRASACGLMLPVDDHTACVGMGGGKCGWVAKWSACLNGDQPFPNGAPDCPHWLPVVPPCESGAE